MRILIYGGGAVGLGLGNALIKAGEDVTLIARPGTVSALKKRGLIRVGIFGRFRAGPGTFACYSFLKELPQKSFDFILVTTKSFDSKSAAYDIKRHRFLFTERTKIVLCQNGWGNAETFSK